MDRTFSNASWRSAMGALLAATMLHSATACANSGTKVTAQQAAALVPGQTTVDQLIATFGPPSNRMSSSEGTTIIMYNHISASANAANYIPIVGMLAGGVSTSNDMATFYFDKNNLLLKHTEMNGA